MSSSIVSLSMGQLPPGAGYPPPPGLPPAQAYGQSPQGAYSPYAAPQAPMGYRGGGEGQLRFDFQGKGGELFGKLFVGAILCVVTLFIYTPWFICKMMNYFASKTTLGPTRRGVVSFAYVGTGGGLFKLYFVNMLLIGVTIGIYTPWAACNFARYFMANVQARTDDGTQYQARFDGTGGALFWRLFGGYWLCMLTLFIYTPWFICGLQRFFASNTKLLENGQEVGSMDFVGEPTTLLGTFIVGWLLTAITCGIYGFWFQISMWKFYAANTKITWQGRTFVGDFDGSGAEFFGTAFVGYLLTLVTLGFYACWFMTNLVKFQLVHHTYREIGGPTPAAAAFAPPQAYG